ncbi:Hypothetical protein SCF082_LOCUS25137 [Durusdinium trenchii]|uniref:Uncharacterized protein n=1 Tax=Durusdinium trenchii TaxID=1381693 RepID=A0ABP0LY71_9DINO
MDFRRSGYRGGYKRLQESILSNKRLAGKCKWCCSPEVQLTSLCHVILTRDFKFMRLRAVRGGSSESTRFRQRTGRIRGKLVLGYDPQLLTTHTDPAGWTKLLVINNAFHMPRTKEIFIKVFGLPPLPNGQYSLDFLEVPDEGVEPDALESRRAREAKSLASFRQRSASISSMQQMHAFLFTEHMAYSSKRLLKDREPVDPKVAESY